MQFTLSSKGVKELLTAIKKNPEAVKKELQSFFVRALAKYSSAIRNNPWRVGGSGGGAPYASGNLLDTHQKEYKPWEARIYPTAPYAPYVHGIEGYPRTRSYQLRPWLDWAKQDQESEVEKLESDLLSNLVSNLAK